MTRGLFVAIAAVVLAAALTVAGASAFSTEPPSHFRDAPRALVLGDSNLYYAHHTVAKALKDAGIDARLDGIAGYGLKDLDTYWLRVLPTMLEQTNPDVVVVALGTNDTVDPADATAFSARLDTLMYAIGNRPVIWVTHYDHRPNQGDRGQHVNADVRVARTRWPNLTVLDLAPLIDKHAHKLLIFDRTHFSDEGKQVLATELKNAAAQLTTPLAAMPAQQSIPVPAAQVPTVTVPFVKEPQTAVYLPIPTPTLPPAALPLVPSLPVG